MNLWTPRLPAGSRIGIGRSRRRRLTVSDMEHVVLDRVPHVWRRTVDVAIHAHFVLYSGHCHTLQNKTRLCN